MSRNEDFKREIVFEPINEKDEENDGLVEFRLIPHKKKNVKMNLKYILLALVIYSVIMSLIGKTSYQLISDMYDRVFYEGGSGVTISSYYGGDY